MKKIQVAAAALLLAFCAVPVRAPSAEKPSAEVQEMLDILSDGEGLSAGDKIPAIKAFLEDNPVEPGAGRLFDLLEKLATEANDRETLEWGRAAREAYNAKKAEKRAEGPGWNAEPAGWTGDEDVPAATREESAEAAKYYDRIDAEFAKLPKLPDVPTGGKLHISAPVVGCEAMNSATRTAPIATFREAVRSAIGCMTPAAEKKFEREFAAALEYPSEKITKWCAAAGPIVLEMSRVRSAILSEAASYDETLAESALARDAGSAGAAHDQLRQLACITASLKAGQAKMAELKARLDALGPMPDPKKEKAKDAADYKAAKRTLKTFFGPEAEIGGWYEAEGHVLSGEMEMALKSNDFKPKGLNDIDWKTSLPKPGWYWSRDRIYIRPLVKFDEQGCALIYMNKTDKLDPEPSGCDFTNTGVCTISDDGSITVYDGSERTVITPFLDDSGKECIAVRYLHRGYFHSVVYRRAGGADLEVLPGKTKDKLEPFADALARVSSDAAAAKAAKSLADGIASFEKACKSYPPLEMMDIPLARDVHYVIARVLPWEEFDINIGEVPAVSRSVGRKFSVRDLKKYYEAAKSFWDEDKYWVTKEPYITCRCIVGTGRFKCRLDRTDEIFFEREEKGFDDHTKERYVVDTGKAYVNLMWETPDPVINVDKGDYSLRVSYNISMSPPSNADMYQGAEIVFGGQWKKLKPNTSGMLEIGCTLYGQNQFAGEATIHPGIGMGMKVRGIAGGISGAQFIYRRVVKPSDEAAAAANLVAAKLKEEAVSEWFEADIEEAEETLAAAERAEKELAEAAAEERRKIREANEAAAKAEREEREQTIAFHKENIKFIEGTISRLEEQLEKASSAAERKSIEWQIACEKSNIIYENDRINAEKTGEWQASRTPFDDMCIVQVREAAAKEVEELARVDRARKFVEKFMETEDEEGKAMILSRMESIADSDPADPGKWERLKQQLIFNRREELSRASAEHEAEIAAIDDSIRYLERVKTVSEIAISVGCGGGSWGVAKGIGCVYMMTTGWIDGGFTNGLDKTVRFASDLAEVALETYDGIKAEGWKGGMKNFEISVAMHYGIPFLMDKLKGPPDGTGCWNAFDMDKLKTWNPKMSTRKPKVADVNAAYFEMKNARQQIKTYMEKKGKFQMLSDVGKDKEAILKARREMFNSVGKINENPVAKGLLKYDKKYLNNGTSLMYSLHMDEMSEIARVRTINDMTLKKGFNKQELVSFRNKSSYLTPGMDTDLGLVETKDMKILRDGKPVSKYEYARNAQESMNAAWKEVSGGCDAQKSFINITFSGDKEAYRTLEILDASKDAQKMREIMRNASPSDVQQMFDVSRVKSLEMEAMKNHPKMVGLYESSRGWAKDLDTKYLPALEGEITILKDMQKEAARFGRDLGKSDLVKLEKLERTYGKYKQISNVCGKVGRMEIPLYEADAAIRTVTGGGGVPRTIEDLSQTLQLLSLQNIEKAKKMKKTKFKVW